MNSKKPKKTVFEVAAEVFHRKGYDNTSMSDVATAAGLTKAGLYHHVSSKESLLFTVLDSGLDFTESYVHQAAGFDCRPSRPPEGDDRPAFASRS